MTNNFNNPYRPPSSMVDDAKNNHQGDEGFLGEPRAVSAGNGITWIGNAWNIFKNQALTWVLMGIVFFIIMIILAFIPILGSIATLFLSPLLSGGFMIACDNQRKSGQVEFGDMFAGFKQNSTNLLILGAIGLAFSIVIMGIMFLTMGGSAMAMSQMSDPENMAAAGSAFGAGMLVFLIIALVLSIFYCACVFLAPALITLQNMSAIDACKLSFKAFTKNILGAILCAIVLSILMIIAMIPLGLGLLIMMPLSIILPYVIYRNLFFNED